MEYAWRRADSGRDVELCAVGAACTSGPSVARDSQADRRGVAVDEWGVRRAVLGHGTAFDRARVCAAGAALAGSVLGPIGAATGRADRLQLAVSLVRRPGHGRRDVEPCGVLEEPRPAAHQRGGAAILRRGEPAGEAVYVRRSLHRGWHVDSGMGIAEELPPEGRFR